MRSRFGKQTGALSFFAFQDIITGTAGFLIVLTLFLALNLDEAITTVTSPTPVAGLEDEVRKLQEQVDEIKKDVAEMQGRPAENESTVKRMIGQLKTTISELESSASPSLGLGDQASALEKRHQDEMRAAQAALERTRAETLAVQRKAAETVSEVEDLRKRATEAGRSIQLNRARQKVLTLIPEKSDTAKEPVLVLVYGSKIEAVRIGELPVEVSSIPAFARYLHGLNSERYYVVMYFKPSGSHLFNALTERARQEGFEIGYDAVPEDVEVRIRREER